MPTSAERPAVIVVTAYDYPQYADAALRLGAAGFVLKTAPIAELVDAIRRVAAGGLAFAVRPGGHALARLSPREHDVVRLVAAGRTNDEIGADLGIGSKTVETHLARLFERLGVASRTELAIRAVREGWLDVPSVGQLTVGSGDRPGRRRRRRGRPRGRAHRSHRLAQRDDREQHREPAVPQRGEREHPGDRDGPAATCPGAPDDDGDREWQPHDERDRDRGPRAVASGDAAQHLRPLEPRVRQQRERDRDHRRGRPERDRQLPPLPTHDEPQADRYPA